jgi:hypothetical protein
MTLHLLAKLKCSLEAVKSLTPNYYLSLLHNKPKMTTHALEPKRALIERSLLFFLHNYFALSFIS